MGGKAQAIENSHKKNENFCFVDSCLPFVKNVDVPSYLSQGFVGLGEEWNHMRKRSIKIHVGTKSINNQRCWVRVIALCSNHK